jgi:hypothetical protein
LSDATPGPWWKRVAWFVGLWAASVTVIGVVAWFLRLWIA